MRILVVEDDALLGDAIQAGLRQSGYAVDWLRDGIAADQALSTEPYAALVLDWGLPRLSGIEVLRRLRARKADIPVILLTARDTVNDRIEGLDSGADDYLVKPFDMGELAARLRALVRRASGSATPSLKAGESELDPASHEVTYQGNPVDLSAKEFALLRALMAVPGAVLSRAELEEALYGWDEEVGSNAVEVHIHNLRNKLGSHAILNIRGAGYRVSMLNDVDS